MRKAICIVGAVLMPLVYAAVAAAVVLAVGSLMLHGFGLADMSSFNYDGIISFSDYFMAGFFGFLIVLWSFLFISGWVTASQYAYEKCQKWWKPRP